MSGTSALATRIPPHDVEAERALLGAMLLSSEVQIEVSGRIKPDDFYRPAHRTIFEAMLSLVAGNIKFDHLTLSDRLTSMQKLDAIGGQAYLVDLVGSVPTSAFWERYADIVSRLATYRRLISAGNLISSIAYETPADVSEAVGTCEQKLFEVTEQHIETGFQALKDKIFPAVQRLEELSMKKGGIVGTPTAFSQFDKMTSGLRGGELIILAARPAVGKTALALNMAIGAAKNNARVAIFSLEMGIEDLTQRILCSAAQINLQDVRSGSVPPDGWDAINVAATGLMGLDVHIDDTPSLNITELRAKARRQFRDMDGKKGLIIVDYLQLMQPARRNTESRQVEIAEISRGLKILAKDLNVPIIALSQLSRMVEQRKGKRPQLSDLRESGAIEQDADIVMFLDRNTDPDVEGTEGRPEKGQAHLIIAKHRNGPTGQITLAFRERYTKFLEVAPSAVH